MGIDRRSALGLLAVAPVALAARAASGAAKLNVGDPLSRFNLLTPGPRSYLISSIKDGRHVAQNIWRREVKFEIFDGKPRFRISQHWDGVGLAPALVERESLFEMGTFRPSLHTRVTTKDGQRIVEGFLFGAHLISGLPGLTDNIRADFSVASDEPMYNFETDIELLQALPWSRGYSVSIPFFHPAPGSVPARYLWSMTDEDALPGPDGRVVDCWVVSCDYNKGTAPTRFWLAKRTQQLIKMEGRGIDGVIRRKTLLY